MPSPLCMYHQLVVHMRPQACNQPPVTHTLTYMDDSTKCVCRVRFGRKPAPVVPERISVPPQIDEPTTLWYWHAANCLALPSVIPRHALRVTLPGTGGRGTPPEPFFRACGMRRIMDVVFWGVGLVGGVEGGRGGVCSPLVRARALSPKLE